eukprot:scaffold12365_cov84-Isochrysis_galbana.AAC.1
MANRTRTFLRKSRQSEPLLVNATPEHAVRFAISAEIECPPDDSRVTTWRKKRRVSFVHKGMFAFELTRVNQGPSEQLNTGKASPREAGGGLATTSKPPITKHTPFPKGGLLLTRVNQGPSEAGGGTSKGRAGINSLS